MLRTRIDKAAREGRRVTGGDVASWLGVSQRTGLRRLAERADEEHVEHDRLQRDDD
jgi:hypothetical protein